MKNTLTIFTDGGSRGNPGPAAYGFVIYSHEELVIKVGEKIGITTNNVAEYTAVLKALLWIKDNLEDKPLTIHYFLDSQLIAKQMSGEYKIKDAKLQKLYNDIRSLEQQLDLKLIFTHVPREENKVADTMVNLALDNKLTSSEHE